MDLNSAEKREVLVETWARKEPLFCSRYVSVPTSSVWKVWTFLTRRSHDFSGNRVGPSRRVTKPLVPKMATAMSPETESNFGSLGESGSSSDICSPSFLHPHSLAAFRISR